VRAFAGALIDGRTGYAVRFRRGRSGRCVTERTAAHVVAIAIRTHSNRTGDWAIHTTCTIKVRYRIVRPRAGTVVHLHLVPVHVGPRALEAHRTPGPRNCRRHCTSVRPAGSQTSRTLMRISISSSAFVYVAARGSFPSVTYSLAICYGVRRTASWRRGTAGCAVHRI
jgi:hypothetical protein